MTLYKGKYRVESARHPQWDYAANGYYFVTICTQNREWFFGEVVAGEMRLSAIGQIAHQFWADIPSHFPHIQPDQFVIMPNHVHGIVAIDRPHVETRNFASLHNPNQFAPLKPNSLQSIVHSYESAVTRWCRKNNRSFAWQPRFHDHIIRDQKSLHGIRVYIANNPLKWQHDRHRPVSLWM